MPAPDQGWTDATARGGEGGSAAACACGLLALALRLAASARGRSPGEPPAGVLPLVLSGWAVASLAALFYDSPRFSTPSFPVRVLGGTALLPIVVVPFALPVPLALHVPLQLGMVAAVGASRGVEVCRAASATPEGRAAVVEAWEAVDGAVGRVLAAMYYGVGGQGGHKGTRGLEQAPASCVHIVGWALLVLAFALPTYAQWVWRRGTGDAPDRHGVERGPGWKLPASELYCGSILMIVMAAVAWVTLAGVLNGHGGAGEAEAGAWEAGSGVPV
ncbi:unnamed protein product [Ostreobium quekettii]|uniref:Uncharacterized protein n=1 Tax=Ostreobium quekettii TaxID=121088 RepID=A0A8S1JFE3_9CHLO|nr:unnamed protein product [Ostreobium quekettii]|eukprot:evm.model.scf_35.2 EVM.evm.TU.scf_35.2   scf_35:8464-9285(+)